MIVEGAAVKISSGTCVSLGVYAGVCGVISTVFGPNISLIEVVAGFAGTMAFYLRAYKPDVHASSPISALVGGLLNLIATLWALQAAYSLVTSNTDIQIPNAAVSGLAFGVAYAMQNLLTRLLSLVEQIKWPWAKSEGAP